MPRRGRKRLLIIGGAEDKLGPARVLRRFVRLAGGTDARVVVIPTASSVEDEMVVVYRSVFQRLGVPTVTAVRPQTRTEADDPELAAALDDATGVFMTGGNQLKLAQVVAGTAVGDAVLAAYERGAVVAGTSAGASIMSSHMISMGDEGVTPRQRASQLSVGLGLLPQVIVDQHFDQRSRYGRLLSLVALSPSLLGMGIDEDTAALVTDGRSVEVLGSGAVFVVDATHALTNAHEARQGSAVLVSGAVVHALPAGARFDLRERRLEQFVERRPDKQVARSHSDREEAKALASRLREGPGEPVAGAASGP
ncbi:cyanophycinase [Angustibacter peucedani]